MNPKSNKYKVTCRTVTPIYFGDAWGRNTSVPRASSIMGSLRFWFEVICYFAGITTNADYKIVGRNRNVVFKADLNQEKFQDKLLKRLKDGTLLSTEEATDKALTEMGIPLPARIFGCTGWQGLIKIGEVKKLSSLRHKNIEEIFDRFEINFITTPQIAECILFPLLMFVERYGFLGGGWNSGFGRVKVSFSETSKEYDIFKDYAEFVNTPVKFTSLVNKVPKKEDLWGDWNNINTINLYQCKIDGNKEDILKELIREKVYLRRKIKNKTERHLVFGTTEGSPQGSKILPWIYEPTDDESKRQYGFISIAGILNIG